MVALLALGLLLTRVVGHGKPRVPEDRAVAIARTHVTFAPHGHTIRFVRRGVPPRAFWVVSFWQRKAGGGYSRTTVVLLDAASGRVTEVRQGR